jgi:hypothetical protein
VRQVGGHDIILLHDGVEPARPKNASQENTVSALPAILDGIGEKELRILPLVDALLPAPAA